MSSTSEYTPPKVWTWNKPNGGRSPTSTGRSPGHSRQGTAGRPPPLAALLAGHAQWRESHRDARGTAGARAIGCEYDAWLIRIGEGDQFGSGFVAVNPNSKIPALMDRSGPTPIRVFESGAILMYLAEKFGAFLPTETAERAECLSWLFWQMGSAPYLGGGFGHFYAYAPTKIEYAIDRFAMEVEAPTGRARPPPRRNASIWPGSEYTIADIAIWPWYGGLAKGRFMGLENSCQCRTTRTSNAGPM